ncbi:hypothetical protein D3C78_1473030 [compost metagenome]
MLQQTVANGPSSRATPVTGRNARISVSRRLGVGWVAKANVATTTSMGAMRSRRLRTNGP